MTQRKKDAEKTAQRGEKACRIGALSRVDFPSDGFRRALLNEADARFRESGVNFVVIAGGLIDGKYVEDKVKGLKRHIAARQKEQKKLAKDLTPPRSKKKDEVSAVPADKVRGIQERLAQLEAEIARFQKYLDELSPERLASRLDTLLPRFTGADGQPLKVHIVPSPAFDRKVGEKVSHLLAEIRGPNLVRVYSAGGARLPIDGGKFVDVLVPRRSAFRGDYYSTQADRQIKDRVRQSSRNLPDLFIIGCGGSSVLKPRGNFKRPYVTVPTCNRFQEVNTSENQIGVRIVTVHRDSGEPEVVTYPFKDFANDEYGFIKLPRNLPDHVRRILETIQQNGSMTTGDLADRTGLKRETVAKELEKLRVGFLPEDRNWPGVRFDPLSMQWDFDKYWLRDNLTYRLKEGKAGRIDRLVSFSCPHAGSVFADLSFFIGETTRAILETDADFLVGAGDFVEGYKYKDELFGAINVDEQQELMAASMAQVMLETFVVRLDDAIKTASAPQAAADTLKLVNRRLITAILKAGNHDDWSLKEGHVPLLTMKLFMVKRLFRGVIEMLDKRGLPYDTIGMLNAIEGKVIEPALGKFALPSGLLMTVMHPHMGGAQTTSLRAQQALDMARDSHIVIEGNFHTGCVVEQWDPELGQRVGQQLGTLKSSSLFEGNKMKRVDTHIGCLEVESVDGRITRVKSSFRTRPEDSRPVLDNREVFLRLAELVGLKIKK